MLVEDLAVDRRRKQCTQKGYHWRIVLKYEETKKV